MNCTKCGRELNDDDIGLHRKLVSRGAVEFMCLGCLAEYFSIPPAKCRELIERWRAAGCTLFK